MDDEDLTTCLSSETHDGNIKDHLIHFLGCIDSSERYQFLHDEKYSLWQDEINHYETLGHSRTKAEQLARDKRERWKSDCQSELRRIDFLRQKLLEDKEESHLIYKVEESHKAWKQCKDYQENIESVRAWRSAREKLNEDARPLYQPANNVAATTYKSEKDINVPFMYFVESRPAEEKVKPGGPVWGKFPDQKTTVYHLLDEAQGNENLLSRERLPQGLKYFHFPSNNMKWAEEAIARYFVQKRPNFHAIRREVQRQAKTEAALVLKESHWRGQLHGGRNTTNARFMRPFCESVSTNPNEVDTIPENLMPYLHWETSRNRERFAQLIEEVVYKKKKQTYKTEIKNKRRRQNEREGLRKPIISRPGDNPKTSSLFKDWTGRVIQAISRSDNESREQEPDNESNYISDSEDDGIPSIRRQVRSRGRIYTMGTLLQRMQLPKSPLEIDDNGRVIINGSERNKLGQYLIDAARLYEGITNYRDKKLLENYLMSDPPLHPRRTLDQAYYWSLNTTRARDQDQVVYRHTTPDAGAFHTYDRDKFEWNGHEEIKGDQICEDCTANIKKVSRLVMVDQLWMWILDSRTIITCFPKRYGANKHDSSGVHKSVRLRIAEGRHKQVKSVYDLALIVLEECSNTFFDRTRTSDKQPQVLDAFSEAIGKIMHKQTISFERLWRWTEDARKHYRTRSDRIPSDIHVPLLDINPEGELEKEIKDIVEELGIMLYVNKEHRDVVRQFITHVTHILDPNDQFQIKANGINAYRSPADTLRTPLASPMGSPRIEITDPMDTVEDTKNAAEKERERRETYKWFKVNADELLTRVNDRIEQLEELERSAEATATSVKDLLDLKSQQAEFGLIADADFYVLMRTLPLSFMSSVFGMNAMEFSDGNFMNLHDQIKWMLIFSVIIIMVTLFFSLSSWARAAVWYVYKRSMTAISVHTGLYQGYLEVDMPSSKLYEEAMEKTEKLKDKEVQARLDQKRRKRREDEKKRKRNGEQTGANNGNPVRRRNGQAASETSPAGRTSAMGRWWDCANGDRNSEQSMV
ncbi:hypothetical protein SUNI508_10994 [Seiridium unicorne]|uniref:Ankyrin repeat protein n=1 Tax=Seiridium unicorne TaxID=138068 RepID=A0ABR2UJS5_9PEZI